MHVITIVNTISETSMPINEFVIYRSAHNYPIKQSLIVCSNGNPQNVSIPENINVRFVGYSIKKMRQAVKQLTKGPNQDSVIVHLHQERSALLFYLSSVGMHLRHKTIYTVHSTYSSRDFKYKLLSCMATFLAGYVTCVSESAYQEYSSFIRKIKKKKILPITNGVDIERIDSIFPSATNIRNNTKRLFYVARMIPIKNHAFLLSVMNELPDHELILIGAEDPEGEIRQLVKDYGLDGKVTFTGLIPRDDVFRLLEPGAIYVSPSKVEGMPVSVLEAMRFGIIPILSQIIPHKEVADKCQHVKTLEFEKTLWVQEIKKISLQSDNTIQLISETIRKETKEQFSLDVMHKKYMDLYKKLERNHA
jgi:glycosyltransferase involved in cell wall biosynthesis